MSLCIAICNCVRMNNYVVVDKVSKTIVPMIKDSHVKSFKAVTVSTYLGVTSI